MNECRFIAADEQGTERLAAALAAVLPPGTTISLLGTLGAGKTRLVQGLAAAYGVSREEVVSPTFVLCQEYHGRRLIYHADAYRIRDDDEFLALGPDEWFESPGITIVEWGDRVARCLPREHLRIEVAVVGDTAREFRISAVGTRYLPTVAALAERLGPP